MEDFQVTQTAAVKKPRKRTPKVSVVTVIQVHPAALALAKGLARGRDVHTEVQTDGSVLVVNGSKP